MKSTTRSSSSFSRSTKAKETTTKAAVTSTATPSTTAVTRSKSSTGSNKKKKQNRPTIYIETQLSTKTAIQLAAEATGYSIVHKPENAQVLWMNRFLSSAEMKALGSTQKINRIAGVDECCYKSDFALMQQRLLYLYPEDAEEALDFIPKTFSTTSSFQMQKFEELLLQENNSKSENKQVESENEDDDEEEENDRKKTNEKKKTANQCQNNKKKKKKQKRQSIWICKTSAGSHGTGCTLTLNPLSLLSSSSSSLGRDRDAVFQEYIARPLLLQNKKFDLRCYLVVSSWQGSLRFYLMREGLARFCSVDYFTTTMRNSSNSSNSQFISALKSTFHNYNMHLTNATLQKNAKEFVENTLVPVKNEQENKADAKDNEEEEEEKDDEKEKEELLIIDDETSTKRRITTCFRQLEQVYRGEFNSEQIWEEIEDICAKTVIMMQPYLLATAGVKNGDASSSSFSRDESSYVPNCFQLLGVDILIDENMKCYLLEVNSRPQTQLDSPVDVEVKTSLCKFICEIAKIGNGCCCSSSSSLVSTPSATAAASSCAASSSSPSSSSSSSSSSCWNSRSSKEEAIAAKHGFSVCHVNTNAPSLHDKYAKPLNSLKDIFITACGSRSSSKNSSVITMTSTQLQKLLRSKNVVKAAASGGNNNSSTSTSTSAAVLTSQDLDVLISKKGFSQVGLTFEQFVDFCLEGSLGDILASSSSIQGISRLNAVIERLA